MEKIMISNVEELRRQKVEKGDIYARMLDQYETYRRTTLPPLHPPTSTTYFGFAAANLALLYLISKQEQFKQEALRWIKTACGYEKWGHAHLVDVDLSASFMLFGFALAYDWMKDDLTADERKLIADKLYLQGQKMMNFIAENPCEGWVCKYWQNHNWINFTGLMTAALALRQEKDVSEWINIAQKNMAIVYPLMAEDGSDYEGIVYWRYGALWLFLYADVAKSLLDKDYFKECQFLKNTINYKFASMVPTIDQSFNIGDTHDTYSSHCLALYYKVASEYQNGFAQELARVVSERYIYKEAYYSKIKPGILPEVFLEYLWKSDIAPRPLSELPTGHYFDDLGLLSYRSSWDKNALAINIKCGYPGGKQQFMRSFEFQKDGLKTRSLSHQHPDDNSFLLFSNGQFLLLDDGYNRNCKAVYHNTLSIDDRGYIDEDVNDVFKSISKDNHGTTLAHYLGKNSAIFVGEAAPLYHPDLQLSSFQRSFILIDNVIVILDHLAAKKASEFALNFQYPHFPLKVKNGHYRLTSGPATVDHFMFNYKNVNKKHHHIKAIMTTQEPDKFCEQDLYDLQVVSAKESSADMINILVINNSAEVREMKNVISVVLPKQKLTIVKGKFDLEGISGEGDWMIINNSGKKVQLFGYMMKKLTIDGKEISINKSPLCVIEKI